MLTPKQRERAKKLAEKERERQAEDAKRDHPDDWFPSEAHKFWNEDARHATNGD